MWFGSVATANVWIPGEQDKGAVVCATEGHLVDLKALEYDEAAECRESLELFRHKLSEAFELVWAQPVQVAFDFELVGTKGGHRRKAPPRDTRPQDKPGFDRLHHIAQLWVDYLTARSEETKQSILFEAAVNLQHYHPCGDEAEAVIALIQEAIRKRGAVFARAGYPKEWATADDAGVSIFFEPVEQLG